MTNDLRGLTLHDISFMATARGETWYAGYTLREGLFIHNIYAARAQYNGMTWDGWREKCGELGIDVPRSMTSMMEGSD